MVKTYRFKHIEPCVSHIIKLTIRSIAMHDRITFWIWFFHCLHGSNRTEIEHEPVQFEISKSNKSHANEYLLGNKNQNQEKATKLIRLCLIWFPLAL